METVEHKAPFPTGEAVRLPWLSGITGRFRVDIGAQPARMFEIKDGVVTARNATGKEAADTVAICDSLESALAIARGDLNPVVAALQGRIRLEGDRAFGIKVILGFQTRMKRTDAPRGG